MKFNFGNVQVNGSPLTYFFKLTAVLFILWMVFSGRFEAKFIIIGLLASIIISYVCMPILVVKSLNSEKEYYLLALSIPKLIIYFFWLLKEIILAAFDVAGSVLRRNMKVNPHVIKFNAYYDNPIAISVLANSIILTPGTITIDAFEDGSFVVHALTDKAADGLLSGEMQKKVAWLFGNGKQNQNQNSAQGQQEVF